MTRSFHGLKSIFRACMDALTGPKPKPAHPMIESLEERQFLSVKSPAALFATTVSASEIHLGWQNRTSARRIQVFRKRGDGEWHRIFTISGKTNNVRIQNLAPGVRYAFRLKAATRREVSGFSKSVAARTAIVPNVSAKPRPFPTPTYSGPIVITRGGVYSGNWQSLKANTPAVLVATAQPVIIQNSHIRGRGNLILAINGADITIANTVGEAMNPNIRGQFAGRFLKADGFTRVVLQNNTLVGTSGIYVHKYLGNNTTYQTVKVLRNLAYNIDGRFSNGNGGWLEGPDDNYYVQFFQIDGVQGLRDAEVAWNQVINQPDKSRVEDNISIYKSSGTAGNPFRIHDNYIKGAYSVNPRRDRNYSGGGIMVSDQGSSFIEAYNNQIVSTSNYGIAISSGHDNDVYNNRVISSGRLSDGTAIPTQNVGIYVWNQNDSPNFARNTVRNNYVGWIRHGERNDYWVPDVQGFVGNDSVPGNVTLATEAAEFTYWQQKVSAVGYFIGAY